MVLHQIVSLSGICASVFVLAPDIAFAIREITISINKAQPFTNGMREIIAASAPYTLIFNIFNAITEMVATSIPENREDVNDEAAIARAMRIKALIVISAPRVLRRVMTVRTETKAVPPLDITTERGVTVEDILFCIPRFERERDSPIREEANMFPLTNAVIIPLSPLPITPYGFFLNPVNKAKSRGRMTNTTTSVATRSAINGCGAAKAVFSCQSPRKNDVPATYT